MTAPGHAISIYTLPPWGRSKSRQPSIGRPRAPNKTNANPEIYRNFFIASHAARARSRAREENHEYRITKNH